MAHEKDLPRQLKGLNLKPCPKNRNMLTQEQIVIAMMCVGDACEAQPHTMICGARKRGYCLSQ